MNHTLERSLCQDCRFVQSCNLTSNKTFIWSCSEYELAKADTKKETKKINKTFDQVLNEPTVALI
ncbi:hypothetical protein SAMN04487989_104181 [Bizionia echini]|uniref:Uncharacterized protein n=1 Tax=Bizionia echini TaxID=649333 RepID=A0A1I5C3Z7_9FLAO|nr:hypothetical protein [Bizionia echini]SFN81554.1 hypothetical protein SAMN04487989_104181 [Bizionia echini]